MTTLARVISRKTMMRSASTGQERSFDARELSRMALKQALRTRSDLQVGLHMPLCPFDVAQKLGVEVRLQNIPSMEGMFCRLRGRPLIVLASERPAGRQNFSCAHEIGHYVFGHGESLDEMMDHETLQLWSAGNRRRHTDPKEFLADSFAGFLLMPKSAVDRAFALRGIRPSSATPEEIYVIASYLGVGYRTLIAHLQFSLRLISPARGEELRRWANKLIALRQNLTGLKVKHVTVVDEGWENRPIDLHIGDHLLLTIPITVQNHCLLETVDVACNPGHSQGQLFRATRQGHGILVCDDRTLDIRVTRQGFAGRSIYRHLDDPEDNLDWAKEDEK